MAIEWAKEADLQLRVSRAIHHLRPAVGFVNLSAPLTAAVDDVDATILSEAVISRHAGAALLKTLFVSRDLEPAAEIFLEVYGLCRLWYRAISNWVPTQNVRAGSKRNTGSSYTECDQYPA